MSARRRLGRHPATVVIGMALGLMASSPASATTAKWSALAIPPILGFDLTSDGTFPTHCLGLGRVTEFDRSDAPRWVVVPHSTSSSAFELGGDAQELRGAAAGWRALRGQWGMGASLRSTRWSQSQSDTGTTEVRRETAEDATLRIGGQWGTAEHGRLVVSASGTRPNQSAVREDGRPPTYRSERSSRASKIPWTVSSLVSLPARGGEIRLYASFSRAPSLVVAREQGRTAWRERSTQTSESVAFGWFGAIEPLDFVGVGIRGSWSSSKQEWIGPIQRYTASRGRTAAVAWFAGGEVRVLRQVALRGGLTQGYRRSSSRRALGPESTFYEDLSATTDRPEASLGLGLTHGPLTGDLRFGTQRPLFDRTVTELSISAAF